MSYTCHTFSGETEFDEVIVSRNFFSLPSEI